MFLELCTFLVTLFQAYGLSENPAILIIGAGSSGIAAATKLWKNNFTNVRILEAENRIGGRIHSIKLGDAVVDLGAEWYHAGEKHVIYDMVKQYDILRDTNVITQLYYSNGTSLNPDVFTNLLGLSKHIHGVDRCFEDEQTSKQFSSAGECFDSIYNRTFFELYRNNTDMQTISFEAREWLQSFLLFSDSSPSLYDTALNSAYKPVEGAKFLNWNGKGFKTMLEIMLQQYPDPSQELKLVNNILLKKLVTKVLWENSSQVKVFCSDNTTYTADHVIFTPSLGVLKANHQSLFQPSLPTDKIRAIGGIGFGAIMKISLHFPYTWWDPSKPLAFIWSSEDRNRILTEFDKGPVKNGRSWLTTHEGFITAENNTRVLMGFFTGEMVPDLEQESDTVLSAGCMYMFRKFLSGRYPNITDPDNITKSTWYSNSHFKGTYSYDSKGTKQGMRHSLAAPLSGKDNYPSVLFAGEATHPYYFGTVHAAVESGYTAAKSLIDFYLDNRRA